MNLSQLRAFVAVVENESFSGAARVLGVTQPAVTQQVQALEADVGAILLHRRYRHVDVTEQGRALLPHARSILAGVEEARSAVDRLADAVTGRLTVAASTTPGQYVLPRLVGGFLREHPEAGVRILVYDTRAVVDAVASGAADLGMTGALVEGADVDHEELGADRLVLVAPADSPFAGLGEVSVQEIAEQPFVMREPGSGTRMVLESTLRAAGVDPADLEVVTELGTSEAIVSAVEGGLGVGVVSHWVADKALELGTIAEVRVARFPVERPFFAVTPRGALSRVSQAFLDFLRGAL